jgi:hypothetical protein
MQSMYQRSDQLLIPGQTGKSPVKTQQSVMRDDPPASNRSSQSIASGTPSSPLAPTLSQRPIRHVVHVSPTKAVRTMSQPISPMVPEDRIHIEQGKHSPVVVQASVLFSNGKVLHRGTPFDVEPVPRQVTPAKVAVTWLTKILNKQKKKHNVGLKKSAKREKASDDGRKQKTKIE